MPSKIIRAESTEALHSAIIAAEEAGQIITQVIPTSHPGEWIMLSQSRPMIEHRSTRRGAS